jgi:hypothetical protein
MDVISNISSSFWYCVMIPWMSLENKVSRNLMNSVLKSLNFRLSWLSFSWFYLVVQNVDILPLNGPKTHLFEALSTHHLLSPFQIIRCYTISAVGRTSLNNLTSDKHVNLSFPHTFLPDCVDKVIGYVTITQLCRSHAYCGNVDLASCCETYNVSPSNHNCFLRNVFRKNSEIRNWEWYTITEVCRLLWFNLSDVAMVLIFYYRHIFSFCVQLFVGRELNSIASNFISWNLHISASRDLVI